MKYIICINLFEFVIWIVIKLLFKSSTVLLDYQLSGWKVFESPILILYVWTYIFVVLYIYAYMFMIYIFLCIIHYYIMFPLGFPGGASGKEPACQCRRCKRHKFDPWVGKILQRKECQLTSVFLPGESQWTEEPGRLQSMGSQRVGGYWSNLTLIHTLPKNKKTPRTNHCLIGL